MEAQLKGFWAWPAFEGERRQLLPGRTPVTLRSESFRDASPAVRPVSDEELLRRYRRGDQDAFRTLYERYRSPLMRFVRRTALVRADAEEIVQETWMGVVHGRERYVAKARFVTYLFSIARRRGIDRWRRRGRHPEMEDADAIERLAAPVGTQPESSFGAEELAAAIATALEALPLLQREAFLLHAETDLTLDEIAQVTGTSRETAKSRVRYALGRLRTSLEPWT